MGWRSPPSGELAVTLKRRPYPTCRICHECGQVEPTSLQFLNYSTSRSWLRMMRNLTSPAQEGVAWSGPPSRHPAGLGRKLRTAWAADGARLPGVWGSGWDLRAGPVFGRPSALVGWPPFSRGSCARTAFRKPCDASSREKRPRVASSSLGPWGLDRHCCRERIPANVFQSCCCRRHGRPRCREWLVAFNGPSDCPQIPYHDYWQSDIRSLDLHWEN